MTKNDKYTPLHLGIGKLTALGALINALDISYTSELFNESVYDEVRKSKRVAYSTDTRTGYYTAFLLFNKETGRAFFITRTANMFYFDV